MQAIMDILNWWYGSKTMTECNGFAVSQYLAVALYVGLVIILSINGQLDNDRLFNLLVLFVGCLISVAVFTLVGPFALVITAVYFFSLALSTLN